MTSSPVLVYCAGVTWDDVRGTDVNLVLALSQEIDVLWVDPPISAAAVLRAPSLAPLRAPRLRPVAPHVMRLSVVTVPWPERRALRRVAAWHVRRSVRGAVRRLGRPVRAFVVSSPEPRFDALPDVPHVFFATDDFAAGGQLFGLDPHRLAVAESQQLARADLLAAVSPQILARWGPRPQPTLLLPNGADVEHYRDVDSAPPPTDVHLPAPIAGVVGQFSARLDLSLLEAVADAGMSLLLVGPLQEGFAAERVRHLLDRPNVAWVGRKAYSDLPSYLRIIDVGLTPYADTAFNRASDPLKTLEYLAAGRPVVSSPLPAVARLRAPSVEAVGDPAGFAAAAWRLASEARDADAASIRREFARSHGWPARAEALLAAIDRIVPLG